jgi:hypothetical protein
MKEVKKENKYLILKIEDVENYFSQFTENKFTTPEEQARIEQEPFWAVVNELDKTNKNKYIICNQDEPYAELVWQIILLGEKAKKNHSE